MMSQASGSSPNKPENRPDRLAAGSPIVTAQFILAAARWVALSLRLCLLQERLLGMESHRTRGPVGRHDWDFEYKDWDHDHGEKTFLGETGDFNGEDIIDIILNNPATSRFIARHLYSKTLLPQQTGCPR